jgi:hypothetical protein
VLRRIRDTIRPGLDEVVLAQQCPTLGPVPDRAWFFWPRLGQALLSAAEAYRTEGNDAESLRWLVRLIGMIQDFRIGLDPDQADLNFEIWAYIQWRAILSQHALSAGEAEELCALLDRLDELRQPLRDRIRKERHLRREDLIDYYRGVEGVGPWTEPGLKHLWTRRLLACEVLRDVESDAVAIDRLFALPAPQRAAAMGRLESAIPDGRPKIEKKSHGYDMICDRSHFENAATVAEMRLAARIGTALAWVEAKEGRLPKTLEELVPRYLPKAPIRPTNAGAVPYSDGTLQAVSWEGKDETWTVRRR